MKIQHLMSHSPAGIKVQARLTVWAANFVRWAAPWVRARVKHPPTRCAMALKQP